MIKSSFAFIISFDGSYLIFLCTIIFLNLKLNKSILSFVLTLCELLIFLLFNLIFPFLKFFRLILEANYQVSFLSIYLYAYHYTLNRR